MRPVKTKEDFVRRYRKGEFGNKMPTWSSYEEAKPYLSPDKLYHLRNKTAAGDTYYNIPGGSIDLVVENNNLNLDNYYITEMCNHYNNLIQGEVMELPIDMGGGLYLLYSRALGVPMRDALKLERFEEYGLTAKYKLQYYLNDKSYKWMEYLLKEYPNHVIEFSTLSRQCGDVPGHNTLFWEVRLY